MTTWSPCKLTGSATATLARRKQFSIKIDNFMTTWPPRELTGSAPATLAKQCSIEICRFATQLPPWELTPQTVTGSRSGVPSGSPFSINTDHFTTTWPPRKLTGSVPATLAHLGKHFSIEICCFTTKWPPWELSPLKKPSHRLRVGVPKPIFN